MSDEYKTLNDAPIGEWIDISCEWVGKKDWRKIQVLYKGNYGAIVAISDKEDRCVGLKTKWRYPINPLEELENKILDKWHSQGIDYAFDGWADIPHRWILQTLVDAGADIDAI